MTAPPWDDDLLESTDEGPRPIYPDLIDDVLGCFNDEYGKSNFIIELNDGYL